MANNFGFGQVYNPVERLRMIASGLAEGNYGKAAGGVIGGDVTPGWNLTKSSANATKKAETKTPTTLTETVAPGPGDGSSGGGGFSAAQVAQINRENAQRGQARNDIKARAAEAESAFEMLFGDLEGLVRDRTDKVRKQSGEKLDQAAGAYTSSIPKIDQSYSALGSYDSTNRGDARDEAKAGFEKTTKSISDARDESIAEIGNYAAKERAGWEADRDAIRRLVGRVDQVDDLGELNQSRNNIEDRVGAARANRAGLQTDAGARGTVDAITNGSTSRFDSALAALDEVSKSALAGTTTGAAAIKAIVDNAGLTEEEKAKANARYGNTYAEQAAL